MTAQEQIEKLQDMLKKRKTLQLIVKKDGRVITGIYPTAWILQALNKPMRLPLSKFILHNMDKKQRKSDFSLEDIISISSHRKELYFNENLIDGTNIPARPKKPPVTIQEVVQGEFRKLGKEAVKLGISRLHIKAQQDNGSIVNGTICALTLKDTNKQILRVSDIQSDSISAMYRKKHRFMDIMQVETLAIGSRQVYDRDQFVSKNKATLKNNPCV